MGNFNRDNRSKPEMNQATCSKCGKACLVPFKPTGNRPIFCSDCFKDQRGSDDRRPADRDSQRSSNEDRRSSYSDRPMYDAVCDNCGNRCRIPFQPRSGRPVYCSHCFEKNEKDAKRSENGVVAQPIQYVEKPKYKEQFDAVNAKLDKILSMLNASAPAKVAPVEKVEAEIPQPAKEVIAKKKPRTAKKKTATKEDKSTKA